MKNHHQSGLKSGDKVVNITSGDKVVMVLYLKVGGDEKSGDKVVMIFKAKKSDSSFND